MASGRGAAAHVEEAQAPLVLLVGVGAGFDHARVEHYDRLTTVGWTYQGGCAVDADLGCGQPHALAEGLSGSHPVGGGVQLGDHELDIGRLHRGGRRTARRNQFPHLCTGTV